MNLSFSVDRFYSLTRLLLSRCSSAIEQDALLQMSFMCGKTCCMWIVCNHNNCLLQFAVERRQYVEDLFAGARIEIAGRLVGENQIRISNNRPGNGDALLCPLITGVADDACGRLVPPILMLSRHSCAAQPWIA